jgi:UDP-N-acetylmuramoylalanine--D-glutamate ligase
VNNELLRPAEPEQLRLDGRNAAVFGVGASGQAAARLLLDHGARVTLLDSNAGAKQIQATGIFAENGVHTILGYDSEHDSHKYDLGIISPGIDEKSAIIENFTKNNPEAPLLGEMELGYRFCKAPLIAITGTNGKTTTTELAQCVLSACGLKAIAAGNIGNPLCELADSSGDYDAIVLEVSSFQLETIGFFRPRVSVWLNFSADHLDRYSSLEEYRRAKLKIFENQTEDDFAIINQLDEIQDVEAQRVSFSAYEADADYHLNRGCVMHNGEVVMDLSQAALKGLHNAENMMAVFAIADLLELDRECVAKTLADYQPPEHRNEFVAAFQGVRYINDSKSTNPDSLEKALLSQDQPVVLIAGGKDKGHDFVSLKQLVGKKTRLALLIGELRHEIHREWAPDVKCQACDSMEDAVKMAYEAAMPGDVVLLSPGTSSFDMYESYKKRGEDFRALVKALAKGFRANPEAGGN